MSELGPLLDVLEEARGLGFLGPGPVETHLSSARRFLAVLGPLAPGRVLDLGSGGGVPALPLAMWLPEARFGLLDSMDRRTQFLREAVERLGLSDRLTVIRERAETAARADEWRAAFDVVTARSFGRPGVTAECGSPFLRVGGVLAVSEPPERFGERWPADGLAALGLVANAAVNEGVAAFRQEQLCPDRYPRRPGIPNKRPLF